MRGSIIVVAAAAALGAAATYDGAQAEYYPRSPAYDYSAAWNQSPGGIGPARDAPRVYGYTQYDTDRERAVPYMRSCGNQRLWRDGRCVKK